MVIAFIVLFMWFVSSEAKAETIVEIAPATFYAGKYDNHFAIMAHERIADKYDVGIVLLLDYDDEYGNRGFQVLRTAKRGNWEAGIGYTWWAQAQPQAWNTDNTFVLTLGYEVTDRWAVRWRHWSTAGTSSRNRGMDMLTVGYSFGQR